MNLNDFLSSLETKSFYRFTGSPEHWLTAIKFFTWGLKREYLGRWQKIEIGDIFFMHSTTKSKYKNVRSGIIGVGVVGPGLRQKDGPLWEEEFAKKENIYPLLVPFSEIYLFSNINVPTSWDFNNELTTTMLIKEMLAPARPLPEGFPVMGSFSSVQLLTAIKILGHGLPNYIRESKFDLDLYRSTPTKLIPIKNALETLRFVPTLKYLKQTPPENERLEMNKTSKFERDNELLEKANESHRQIIDEALAILRTQGYDTFANMHADLVAENEKRILLFEAKSLPEGAFRVQARKAVGQLYQYEYFDIRNHQEQQQAKKPVKKFYCFLKIQLTKIIPASLNGQTYQQNVYWGAD